MRPGCDLLQLARRLRLRSTTALPFTDRMTSPGRSAPADGPSGSTSVTTAPDWPDGICSRRAICGVTLLERQAEAAAALLLRRLAVRRCCGSARCVLLGLEVELVDGDVQRLLLLVAQHLHRHRSCPAWSPTTIFTQLVVLVTGRPLYSTITSPGSMPAFAAAPPGATCDTMRAGARLAGRSPRSRRAAPAVTEHADASADDLAGAAAAAAGRARC